MRLSNCIVLFVTTSLTWTCGVHSSKKKFDDFLNGVDSEVFEGFMNEEIIHKNVAINVVFPTSIKYLGFTGFIVEFDKKRSDEIISSIGKEYAHNLALSDPCIYFVGRDDDKICSKVQYPILDFQHNLLYSGGLSGDLVINIINQKAGNYLDDQYLYENNNVPVGIKHGFSNGYITNKKNGKIFFWLVVW